MTKRTNYHLSAEAVKQNFFILLLSVTCLFSIAIGEYILFSGMKSSRKISPTPQATSSPNPSSPFPTPTCRPRPACLDNNPRCLIPETEDMCPPKNTPPNSKKGCTLEAKICPDGSYVGRSGPDCEFTPCPK